MECRGRPKTLKALAKHLDDSQGNLERKLCSIPVRQPILAIKWNDTWLDANADGQKQVTDCITSHGGEDWKNTGFAFHFKMFAHLMNSRKALKEAFPGAFTMSCSLVAKLSELGICMPTPVPLGEAWIVMRIGKNRYDCAYDSSFFSM